MLKVIVEQGIKVLYFYEVFPVKIRNVKIPLDSCLPLFSCCRSWKENEEAGDTSYSFLSNSSIAFKAVDMVPSPVWAQK